MVALGLARAKKVGCLSELGTVAAIKQPSVVIWWWHRECFVQSCVGLVVAFWQNAWSTAAIRQPPVARQ